MLVEHSLQVHRERREPLRTPFRDRPEGRRPGVQQSPDARFGTVVEARLTPFFDDRRQRAVGDESALERTEDQTLRAFIAEREMLKAFDAIGFHLLELAERPDGLSDGLAESLLPEARVLSGDEQI